MRHLRSIILHTVVCPFQNTQQPLNDAITSMHIVTFPSKINYGYWIKKNDEDCNCHWGRFCLLFLTKVDKILSNYV